MAHSCCGSVTSTMPCTLHTNTRWRLRACVRACLCVHARVSLRPDRQTPCEVSMSFFSVSPSLFFVFFFLLSPSFHPSIYKRGPGPPSLSSQHPLNLSVHLPNQSVHSWYNNKCQTPSPPTLFSLFSFSSDWLKKNDPHRRIFFFFIVPFLRNTQYVCTCEMCPERDYL